MNIQLLKQKDFALLMLGKLVSLLGTQMQNFALSLYVLKITGSASKFASVLAVTLIPQIFLGPIAGVLVDWFDRKKIIVYLDMIRGIIIGIYAAIFMANGELTLGSIYGLVILMSLASLLFQPAIGTVIPSIVKKEQLVDANGVNSLIMNMGNFVAPALAGILFGYYGLFIILIVNSISFILSSVSEVFIKIPKTNKIPSKMNIKVFASDFNKGIIFIRDKKLLYTIIILGLAINFFTGPLFTVGLTYIAKKILMVTDMQYGLMESILVISMMASPFLASYITKKIKLGKIIFLNIFISSLLIYLIAVVSSNRFLNLFAGNLIPFVALVSIIFVIAMISGVSNIAIGTTFQKEVPLDMMGRVSTVMSSTCMAAMPLGQIIIGFMFDNMQAWICVSMCSTMLLLTILAFRKNLCKEEDGGNREKEIHNIETANAI